MMTGSFSGVISTAAAPAIRSFAQTCGVGASSKRAIPTDAIVFIVRVSSLGIKKCRTAENAEQRGGATDKPSDLCAMDVATYRIHSGAAIGGRAPLRAALRPLRFFVRYLRTSDLCQNCLHHFSMHIRQPKIASLESIRQPRVVDSQAMQDRRIEHM